MCYFYATLAIVGSIAAFWALAEIVHFFVS